MTKHCPRCDTDRPIADFNKKRNGLQPFCRFCNAVYLKQHYKKNVAYYVAKAANLKAKLMGFLDEYLSSHPCVDCGESDTIVLDFDHVRGEKHDGVVQMALSGVSMARLLAEIAKCEVRCANCHRRATYRRRMEDQGQAAS